MKIIFGAAASILVLTLLEQPVEACTCATSLYPSERLDGSAAAFVGTVVGKRLATEQTGFRSVEVVFKVNHAWKGVEVGQKVVVYTPSSGPACGYNFQLGETYLVYANGNADVLISSKCLGNKQVAAAATEIRYLDSLAAGQATGTIFGRVYFDWTDDPEGRLVNVEDSDGSVRTARTDAEGRYVLEGLDPGAYTLRVPISAALNPDPRETAVELRGPGDAIEQNLGSHKGGRIRFRVFDSAGVPASGLLTYANGRRPSRTDSNGIVTLVGLAPGDYRIGISFGRYGTIKEAWVHPGAWGLEGDVVTLGAGDVIELPDLVLPFRLQRCRVDVQVGLPGGAGVEGVKVTVHDGGSVADRVTGRDGRTWFEGYAQNEYTLQAGLWEDGKLLYSGYRTYFRPCLNRVIDLELVERSDLPEPDN